MDKKIGIIGCGNMGEALVSRLITHLDKSTALFVSEADARRREDIQAKYKIIVSIDNNYVVKFADVIIIAVKPKDVDALLRSEICCGVSPAKLIISIVAGISTAYIEKIVGADVPVIRIMPNMAALVGAAVSSMSAGRAAMPQHRAIARELFSLIGTVVEVDEKDVDAVTALSGSGPAYFFYVIESMLEAAAELGIDPTVARALVVQTALGSARVLEVLNADPAAVRAKVASKGGTTEAALTVFESKKVKTAIKEAVRAAYERSRALAER